MTLLIFLFWFSLAVIFYSYAGYGILLTGLVWLKKLFSKKPAGGALQAFQPEVTLVVAAFNEEDFIEKKIANSLALDYDPARLKFIFISDGSSDQTAAIVSRYEGIRHLHLPERKGKVAAMNRAIRYVETPFVIFSDANTLLNRDCIKNIVRHYADPRVGAVAGEKKIIEAAQHQAAGVGEGLYWKYESYLKRKDSELYSVVGAAGELFSTRTNLFEQTRDDIIIEDFVQSLTICMKGHVVRYEPEAYALETSSASMKEEEKRKVRICAGAFQAMWILRGLLNPFRFPVLSFQYLSHRVLRWTLSPLCLVLLALTNVLICMFQGPAIYRILLVLQAIFYAAAGIGRYYAHRNIQAKVFYLPYYFLFMNLAVFMGFRRFVRGNQTVLWERAQRRPA